MCLIMKEKNCLVQERPTCDASPTKKKFSEMTLSEVYASVAPPEYDGKAPKLLATVTSETPQTYKETVYQAVFPALAIYPKKVSFPYLDNQPRELRSNCLTIAKTGSGKDVCIREPLKFILEDVHQRDEINRVRLAQFNAEYNSKSANSTKPPRPDDLIIQTIKSDITRAALYQRMDEAHGAPLYARLSEMEQWDRIESATGRNNQFTTLKLADDEGNDFGADRAGTQSVTASGSLFLNWNACTTIGKAIKYFQYVVTDGPISRICLATVKPTEIGADIPKFGNYGPKYAEKLKPYIENLKAAKGIIKCSQALKMVRALKQECDDFSILTQDRVFDNLTHRALVHVFRKACLLYIANGMKWEKSIEDFCRWSLHYDLWLKMKIWGDAIRKEDSDVKLSKRGPKNLLDELTTDKDGVFTFEDLVNLRKANGKSEGGTRNILSKWKERGHIRQLTNDTFQKLS